MDIITLLFIYGKRSCICVSLLKYFKSTASNKTSYYRLLGYYKCVIYMHVFRIIWRGQTSSTTLPTNLLLLKPKWEVFSQRSQTVFILTQYKRQHASTYKSINQSKLNNKYIYPFTTQKIINLKRQILNQNTFFSHG